MRLLSRCTSYVLLFAACLCLTGCFQAQMTTTRTPGDTVVEEKWAPSYLYGLVPATVDVAEQCSSGIASAERKLSFLNMLVGAITLNIYTPQTVTVTCASGGSMSDAGPGTPAQNVPAGTAAAQTPDVQAPDAQLLDGPETVRE